MLISGTGRPIMGSVVYDGNRPLQDSDIYAQIAQLVNRVAKLERELAAMEGQVFNLGMCQCSLPDVKVSQVNISDKKTKPRNL